MAPSSFHRLATTWSLLALTTKFSGVAAKTVCETHGYIRICKTYTVNTGAIVGIVLSVGDVLCIISAIITHERRKRRLAVSKEPPKTTTAPTVPGWSPPTAGAMVVAGSPGEKSNVTPSTIGLGGQPDLLAYTPNNNAAVVMPQPTSNTDLEKGQVTTVTYPPNTYSPAYTPAATENPHVVYSPPAGPPTSSPPPFKAQPSY
ncbi:hypothetical protein CPB86DRAFT_786245 [Serendipita vermifera]|nr:hypothetical protein CPB86DRAFT_786245 [Serendipita vermifera]